MKDRNRKGLNRWLGAAALGFALSASCGAPLELSTPTPVPTATREPTATYAPTQTLPPTPSRTPTSMPTSTPTGTPTTGADGSEYVPAPFHGCWHLETEDVSFEIELEQQGAQVQGIFLLIKVCVVAGTPSACRIREGLIEGTVAMEKLEIRFSIPEYGGEGTALLTLADDGETLFWEGLEYPVAGLSDGGPHYLPLKFTLIPC